MPQRVVKDQMRDGKTPASVEIRAQPTPPFNDPTLGVRVAQKRQPPAPHRLVCIGDSLTHGMQSAAVFNTDLSYPMIVAWEMGWDDHFRRAEYPGYGGLPLNLEYVVRRLEDRFGAHIDWYKTPLALFELTHILAEVEWYWNLGPGSVVPREVGIKHNLAVFGWDLRDALYRTADTEAAALAQFKRPLAREIIDCAQERAGLRVLASARSGGRALTVFQAAASLGAEGTSVDRDAPGIETLIVLLGANNAVQSMVQLKAAWSKAPDYKDPGRKHAFTVWDPEHFCDELREVNREVRKIRAQHAIFGTVPHVTVIPIARGVNRDRPGQKVEPGSRYYPYYTRPWIDDAHFDPSDDPHLTAADARAIDSAIDQYNAAIAEMVKTARREGLDWYLLDVAGLLDSLAHRRYLEDPAARPDWWKPYPMPAALARLEPPPDSRFFLSGPNGRTEGGLFSLDGVHPTTVCYGVLAQEFIRVMELAGVKFYFGNGTTERPGPVQVDFERLIRADTLVHAPPQSFGSDFALLCWLDTKLHLLRNLLRARRIEHDPAPDATASEDLFPSHR